MEERLNTLATPSDECGEDAALVGVLDAQKRETVGFVSETRDRLHAIQEELARAAGRLREQQSAWDERQAGTQTEFHRRQAELEQRQAELAVRIEKDATARSAVAREFESRERILAGREAELERLREALLTDQQSLQAERSSAAEPVSKKSLDEIATLEKRLASAEARRAALEAAGEAQRTDWSRKLAEARAEMERLQAQPVAAAPDDGRLGDLEQRLQMAIEELRNERNRVVELQSQLASSRSQASKPGSRTADVGSGMDWESQKQRLLQALDDDLDDDSPEEQRERLSIAETIRVTQGIVEQKERELEELRRLLEQQSTSFGSMALGASALSDLVDKDEILQVERQKLSELQNEWQTKLRTAEVELSLERAKLARERVDLEGKLRDIEQAESTRIKSPSGGSSGGKKAQGGRWLTRLGLRESDS